MRQSYWAGSWPQLVAHFENTDHRRRRTLPPHGDIEPLQIGREKACSRSLDRRRSTNLPVMIGVLLLKDEDRPFTTDGVDALLRCVVKNIVAVPDSRKRFDRLPASCIKDVQPSWKSGYF